MLRSILLVEDNPKDAELAMLALDNFQIINKVDHVQDGAEALDYLTLAGAYASRPKPPPAVIILDLKMPRLDGHQFLEKVRAVPRAARVPLIVFTSSRLDDDIERAYALGANSYVVKPMAFKDYMKAIGDIGFMYGTLNELPSHRLFSSPPRRH